MSHFAKVVKSKVVRVIKADQEFMNTFKDDSPGKWIETFKDRSQRTHFAGINYTYDADRDAFIPPQDYPSWTLNTDTLVWECPVAYPTEEGSYSWNEETTSWDVIE